MAGAEYGGAELFFERLAGQFHAENVSQMLCIKPYKDRIDRLANEGITPQRCGFRPVMKLFDTCRIYQQVKQFSPTVVMSWMNRATSFVPSGKWTHVARLGGYYNLKYYRKCDWLVGNTRGIADWLVQKGWPADKVHHQVNFVPAPEGDAAPRSTFDTDEDCPLIIALGRLHPNKGFDTLLNALARTKEFVLWIAGDGPERRRLEALSAELGIARRVRFLGWQTNPQSIIAAGDLFICPSRNEPFGNVIAEAFACGKPIIATRSAGAVEYISDGYDGVLVPIDDAAALAAEIDQLIANKAAAKKLGTAAYETWNRLFNPKKVTQEWLTFLGEVAR